MSVLKFSIIKVVRFPVLVKLLLSKVAPTSYARRELLIEAPLYLGLSPTCEITIAQLSDIVKTY